MGEPSPRLLRRRFWESCQPCYPYLGHCYQHLSKGVLIERGEERELKELRLRVTRLEEENNRLRVITQESQVSLAHLRTLVDHFAQTTLNVHGTEEGIKEEVQRLKRLIDGDPGLGISGLRKDSQDTRAEVARLVEVEKAVANQIKGARLLAASIGLTTGGVIGFIMGLFGG